jgi:hypothetical protein
MTSRSRRRHHETLKACRVLSAGRPADVVGEVREMA